jgi:hypothetical protein
MEPKASAADKPNGEVSLKDEALVAEMVVDGGRVAEVDDGMEVGMLRGVGTARRGREEGQEVRWGSVGLAFVAEEEDVGLLVANGVQVAGLVSNGLVLSVLGTLPPPMLNVEAKSPKTSECSLSELPALWSLPICCASPAAASSSACSRRCSFSNSALFSGNTTGISGFGRIHPSASAIL